ncbi:MAG: hypothetical protein NT118_10785, partial [Lentisphaerae bacterium]|nr:hypothetical protein [Lentisphaerota bacterium]
AIASEMKLSDNERIAAVYPLEEGKIYSFGVTGKEGEFLPVDELSGSFSVADFMETFPEVRIAALQRDASILPKEILDKAVLFSEFPVANLVFINSNSWEGDSVRDLIYMRPAVNVAPMSVRIGVISDQ